MPRERAERLRVEDSVDKINDLAYERGWTDGLPVIPPTPERVAAMMATVDRDPEQVVGILFPRQGRATIERLAINAVMAGCLPSYFPVVVAAVEALLDPTLDLFAINTTTNPAAPLLILNGPIRQALEVNCGYGVLGPGHRANATIGRAIGLILRNIAGRVPGEVCKSTHGQPGAYTFCIAEYEEKSPWEPLHVERGFGAEESTVTVLFPTGTVNMLDHESTEADDLLATFAGSMTVLGSNNLYPDYGHAEMLLLLCPDHAGYLARSLTKQQVKEALLEKTGRIPLAAFPPHRQQTLREHSPDQVHGDFVRLATRADQFLIVVAGGLGGYYSVFLPTIGPYRAVTRTIPT